MAQRGKGKARFWILTPSGEMARIALADGQTLEYATGGPNEEGYSVSTVTMSRDGDMVTIDEYTRGRDCDGGYASGCVRECHISALESRSVEWIRTGELLSLPDWQPVGHWQRDYRAEAAGC